MRPLQRCWLVFIPIACAMACSTTAFGAERHGAPTMQQIAPARTDQPLTNPGMGIYLNGTVDPSLMPPDAWFAPIISVGYFRDDWADLVPDAEGECRFDEYFGPIFDLWVKTWHKRVSFRFMCSNMHSRRTYVSPKWVFDKGVPYVIHKGLYTDVQYDPVFWDDTYLAIQERFIADLGEYLDGRPGLEFIDIGSIGEWGEMHLSRWTPEELAATGYTDDTYIAAYRRIIDAFAAAFPNTRVFLNVGDFDAINDYAALRGLHFRQDGLTPSGPSADVGKRFYRPYSRRGVICNYEFHSGYDSMVEKGWGIRETFEKGLEDPISYLHINLTGYWQLPDPPAELKEAILDAAKRIGFRFALTRLRWNDVVRMDGTRPGRLLIEHTWQNLGVAPCYDSYALRWSLADSEGDTVAESVAYPKHPTTLWWPGDEIVLRSLLAVPPDTPPGVYRLKLQMLKPEEPDLQIALDLRDRDPDGRYDLCDVRTERVARTTEMVYSESFGSGLAGWTAADGMALSLDPEGHGDRSSLLVAGIQPGGAWNYAGLNLDTPILPYSRYRLSCWMKVDAIEPGEAPYFKLGVSDSDGDWLTNFNTNRYDLRDLGTWQRLTAYADTPGDTATGHLAIEKGVLETSIAATIRIDDIELELLESP
jgi:hypothetical protein